MINDPDAAVNEEPELARLECNISEVKALIKHSLKAAMFFAENTPARFYEHAFRRHMDRAQELSDILADMLRPTPRGNDEVPF